MQNFLENKNWHTKSTELVLKEIESSENGLTEQEARQRIKKYGRNQLPAAKAESLLIIFIRQFKNPLIYLLIAASLIMFAIDDAKDAIIILSVLVFNAVVGSIQEGRAQNTLTALKNFAATTATIIRDGKELIIDDTEVVPGDILILNEGDKIPADARLIIAHNMRTNESSLTGESEPVPKLSKELKEVNLAITDQKNMIYKGTHIAAGHGKAVVIATGNNTAIGKIASKIAGIDTEIPLKASIEQLSRVIIIAVLIINTILFSLGVALGKPIEEMFKTVVSLSVSIIPEGLAIVVTLVLASGVWRMSKRNALVKRLQAVEALGHASVIAVDKTGTITKNEMVVEKAFIDEKFFEIGGVGYEPNGEISIKGEKINGKDNPELILAAKIAALCANAHTSLDSETNTWKVIGDPTEAALNIFAQKLDIDKQKLEENHQIISEIPFDYKTKYHAVLYKNNGKFDIAVAGAPENVLKLCANSKKHELLKKTFTQMSEQGLRVIALAHKPDAGNSLTADSVSELTFIGLLGMKDGLKPEVKEAMEKANKAGVKVVMITGDHKLTAKAIATEAGIYHEGEEIITGSDVDAMSDQELAGKLGKVSIFARVTPEHKLKIINAYRKLGIVIAMTGDGVNDAPSLVAADLGVAMGKIGTEVAKEASDIVLLDDNFGSIVAAIEEGRRIYKTIKKVILYLFSTSMGEVLTITGAIVLGLPLPIAAAQIIWLNLVTDGFLDVSLAMEPKDKGLLQEKFSNKRSLVDKLMLQRIVTMSVPMMIGTLILFNHYHETDLTKAWTISLTTLAVFQWFNALNCRHETKSIFQMNPFSNKALLVALVCVIGLQFVAIYNPFMQGILETTSLETGDWISIIPFAASIIIVEEIRKFIARALA